MNKAVILDRDGVINEDGSYLYRPEDIRFQDGIFEFCRKAKKNGYLLIVATNQSGIGRGLYSEDDFQALSAWMCERFREEGTELNAIYFCPNHPEKGVGKYKCDSFDRKPNPGMFMKAIKDFDLEPERCLTIGDKDSDMEAGKRAGIGKLLLMPGKYNCCPGDNVIIIHSLQDAALFLSP